MILEVVSQQTQIARAIERANRFVARFPSPAVLADASPADAIREWSGLGYYRRAINLRLAAIRIVEDHEGEVPRDLDALERLPGVGPYTARAIAVHAFGRTVAPLDTNLRRVLTRFSGSAENLQERADEFVATGRSAAVVRALMDLAALVCRPAAPECDACPLSSACASAFAVHPAAPARSAAPPFIGSRRWVRGRILERLSAADAWVSMESLGAALPDADVADVVRRMAVDGLVELDDGNVRLATRT